MHFGGLINRKDETMKKGRILIILVIAVLMLLPACDSGKQEINVVHNGGSDFPIDKVSPEWDSVKLGLIRPFENRAEFESGENGKTYEFTSGYGLGGTSRVSDIERAHLVMTGIVLGFDFQGEDFVDLATMYHVLPTEIFRGTPKTTEDGLVDVQMGGGQTDTYMLDSNGIRELTVGQEYLLVLTDPISNGEGVGTNDVGYYWSGMGLGTMTLSEAKDRDRDWKYSYLIPYEYWDYSEDFENGLITYADFKAMMDEINASVPVQTESEMRKEYVDRWRYTIDTYVSDGRMTQEEYDEAKAWLDAYESYTGD